LEKEESEEAEPVKVRRPVSPTLPDGDLPSYMKATESYFKKVCLYYIPIYPYKKVCLYYIPMGSRLYAH